MGMFKSEKTEVDGGEVSPSESHAEVGTVIQSNADQLERRLGNRQIQLIAIGMN